MTTGSRAHNGFTDLKRDDEVLELSGETRRSGASCTALGKGRRFKSARPHHKLSIPTVFRRLRRNQNAFRQEAEVGCQMSRLKKSEAASDFAVLFDLEDTLVQTPWSIHEHVLEFRQNTRKKLLALGVPAEILEGVERATIMRNKAEAYIEENFTKTETRRFQREMEKFLGRYELDSARKSRLFPDCVSTLGTLRRLGAKLGLVTNTSKEAVAIVFQIHGLGSFFDVTVTERALEN